MERASLISQLLGERQEVPATPCIFAKRLLQTCRAAESLQAPFLSAEERCRLQKFIEVWCGGELAAALRTECAFVRCKYLRASYKVDADVFEVISQ